MLPLLAFGIVAAPGQLGATLSPARSRGGTPDGRVVRTVAEASLAHLADGWGWTYRGDAFHELWPNDMMDPYWRLHLSVGGVQVEFMEAVEDHTPPKPPAGTTFWVGAEVQASSAAKARRWLTSVRGQPDASAFSVQGRRVLGQFTYDLHRGVALGTLRRRVEAFARLLSNARGPLSPVQ